MMESHCKEKKVESDEKVKRQTWKGLENIM